MKFTAVCSPNPSAPTYQSTGRSGLWVRDPYHIRRSADPSRTRCGRDCSNWIVVGEKDQVDDDCCVRCLSVTDREKQ